MVLEIFDRALTRQGAIDKIDTLIWTRRYWKPGCFKLLVPFTLENMLLLAKSKYISKPGDMELGEVSFVRIVKDKRGAEMLEAQGLFLAGWIGRRLVLNPIVAADRPQNVILRIVRENIIQPSIERRRIGNIAAMGIAGIVRGNIEYATEFLENALTACESVAINSKLGFRIFTDLRERAHHFEIYDGKDLTAGQAENPPCIFREEFDNVREQEYVSSFENYKTTAYVAGEERDDIPRRVVEVGNTASGLDRMEVFVNASDVRQNFRDEAGNEITLTNAQVDGLLRQRGMTELDYFQKVLSYSAKIKPKSNLAYKADYDVGDRVTCINERWGVQINVRITEAAEIYKRGSEDVEVTFGENLPTLIESLRRL